MADIAGGDRATASEVILALFDVLGFRAWVNSASLDEIASTYRDLLERAVLRPAMECLGVKENSYGQLVPIHFSLPVNFACFSDTILLWVTRESHHGTPFVARCCDLVCVALSMGIPLRGAISVGMAVLDPATSTYIGRPIVEAYDLERAQEWIGAAFAPSAVESDVISELDPQGYLEYDAPLKAGTSELASPFVLDWPRQWREQERSGSEISAPGKGTYQLKYDHTRAFMRYSAGEQPAQEDRPVGSAGSAP